MITTVNLSYSVSGQTITPVQESTYLLASNTVKYVKAQFALDENWASCDSVKAVWSGINSRIVKLLDTDGICYVPHELLAKQQKVYVNLTGSDFEEDTLIDRITTYPLYALNVNATAYTDGSETAPITPSQFEQFVEAVKDEVGKIKDIDSVELNADYTLTISFSDGTETTVGPIRGEQGETGNGIASAVLNDDYTLTLTFTDGTSYTTPSIRGEQGEQGEPGEVTLAQLSAVLPTDTASGSIASFPDGSDLFDYLSCVVNINPLQDLHGYDKPWVGGAGKNKFSRETINVTAYEEYTVDSIPAGTYVFSTVVTSTNTVESVVIAFKDAGGNTLVSKAITPNSGTRQFTTSFTTSTPIAKIGLYSGSGWAGAQGHTSVWSYNMVADSSVTSYEPYSNICPITGWTGCEVSQSPYEQTEKHTITGKNLFNAPNDYAGHLVPCHIDANQSFVASASISCGIRYYDASKVQIDYWSSLPNSYGNRKYRAITASQAIEYVEFYGSGNPTDLMIELGNSPSDYEPYGNHYSITWQTEAGTVYGGTVDVVTGVLTVTHISKTYAVDDMNNSDGFPGWENAGIKNVVAPDGGDALFATLDSNIHNGQFFRYSTTSTNDVLYFLTNNASRPFYGMTQTQIKQEYSGLDIQIKFPLLVPQTYQLTPTQIHALLGQNNVWANCGDTSVTYKADVQRWVEKMLGQ